MDRNIRKEFEQVWIAMDKILLKIQKLESIAIVDIEDDVKQIEKTGGEFREFMKTYSPKLESGKTIKEEEEE